MEVIVILLIFLYNMEKMEVVSTSSTNGSPAITYIDISPQGILYSLDRLLVSEAYRRFFPVIYDVNNLYLSGNTGWNISSNSNSTNLCFNYNSSNKCYHDLTGNTYITGDLYRSGVSLTSTLSNLNTVNISNALWCRYQAINNSTAISIPASTSLLVLNCTFSGNVTINFDQPISNYCQAGGFLHWNKSIQLDT